MENPQDLKYTKEHEWVKVQEGIATCGITDFAQHALTDIVFVEAPEKGVKAEQSKAIATIESVKSVSDVFAPVSGEVIEVNESLNEAPEKVNNDPYGEGWLFRIKVADESELDNLMDSKQYTEMTEKEEH